MPSVNFYDANGGSLGEMESPELEELPERLARLRIYGEEDTGPETSYYATLSAALRKFPRRIDVISICDVRHVSPELLSFLVATFKKTNSLTIENTLHDSSTFGCLKAGLVELDGFKALDLECGGSEESEEVYEIYNSDGLVLFEGIASAACLEKLDLHANFYDNERMGRLLVDAIKRNDTLSYFHLQLNMSFEDETLLSELFSVAVLESKIRDLSMCNKGDIVELESETIVDVLCRKDCIIEDLFLSNIKLATNEQDCDSDSSESFEYAENKSVTDLGLVSTELSCSQLIKTAEFFRSVMCLRLCNNPLLDLSPLDKMLMRDGAILQVLNLSYCKIEEKHMKTFLEKLPRMKVLNYLNISGNPCLQSKSCLSAIVDAVWLNTSLEFLYYRQSKFGKEYFERMEVPLSLNRGAKRSIWQSMNSFPSNLLPMVLERATRLKYYSYRNYG